MRNFERKLAVVTGAGTGMGRELSRQLAAEGCHLGLCDVQPQALAETSAACREASPEGTRISATECDVADEAQVLAFRDDVLRSHERASIDLLINNAGVGGGGSFVLDRREDWDRTFAVCWGGVYYCCRAFLPSLLRSDDAHIVNTSSVNGFWACLGPDLPHTAYSSAKFAVKGFTEALRIDLRHNAPHVKVSLVMPGHIGTSILQNSQRLLHQRNIEEMSEEDLLPLRRHLQRQGIDPRGVTDEQLRQEFKRFADGYRDQAPMSAAEAARVILDGVRDERWRILVGEDAKTLDAAVREAPEEAYEPSFMEKLADGGYFNSRRTPR